MQEEWPDLALQERKLQLGRKKEKKSKMDLLIAKRKKMNRRLRMIMTRQNNLEVQSHSQPLVRAPPLV